MVGQIARETKHWRKTAAQPTSQIRMTTLDALSTAPGPPGPSGQGATVTARRQGLEPVATQHLLMTRTSALVRQVKLGKEIMIVHMFTSSPFLCIPQAML